MAAAFVAWSIKTAMITTSQKKTIRIRVLLNIDNLRSKEQTSLTSSSRCLTKRVRGGP